MCTTSSVVVEYTRSSHLAFSTTPPLIFTEGQKVRNLATFSTTLDFEQLSFQNGVRYLKSNFNLLRFAEMIVLRAGQVWRSLVYAPLSQLTSVFGIPLKRRKHFFNRQ